MKKECSLFTRGDGYFSPLNFITSRVLIHKMKQSYVDKSTQMANRLLLSFDKLLTAYFRKKSSVFFGT